MCTLPSPVSMTGTLAVVTTRWISSRPPRGISTSILPRAPIMASAPSRPQASTEATASAGRPTDSRASRIRCQQRHVGVRRGAAAAQQHGVAALQGQAGDVDGDVGAGLVDGADHAHRDVDLAQAQPVGQGLAAQHGAHGIGQPGQFLQGGDQRVDALVVEREPVQQRLGGAVGAARRHVLGVGLDHVPAVGIQRCGNGQQRPVLPVAVGAGQHARGGRARSASLPTAARGRLGSAAPVRASERVCIASMFWLMIPILRWMRRARPHVKHGGGPLARRRRCLDDDQVVDVHHGTFVRAAQVLAELLRGAAQHLRQFGRGVVHQAAGHDDARRRR